MTEVRTLSGISTEAIHKAFAAAFADYAEPLDMTLPKLEHMLERRGCNTELSFGAYNSLNEIVSFTLNGIGDWNSTLTAYDTGTGTIKEYRQQGLAARVFNESLPVLKQNGIKQYLLEVIKVNNKAIDLYKKQGFEVSREFDYYVSPVDKLNIAKTKLPKGFTIEETHLHKQDWKQLKTFWSFLPSWQNSVNSLNRTPEFFKTFVVMEEGHIIGYGIIEPSTGDIPQFAVAKPYRGKGIGTALFSELVKYTETGMLKFINSDASYPSFREFMTSLGFTPGHGQYEMTMML